MAIQDTTKPFEIIYNTNSQGTPISVLIQNETHTILDGCCILAQVPDSYYHVVISGMIEKSITTELISATQYKVSYKEGIVYFFSSLEGTSITITSYYGVGYKRIFAERVKISDQDNYYGSIEAEGAFKEIYERVNNIILNNPQPSEVVDARYNSVAATPVTYATLKQRCDGDYQYFDNIITSYFSDTVYVDLSYAFDKTGVTDNTIKWNNMVAALTEGIEIKFPKGTYKGNFITSKSFNIDFCGSIIIPVSNSLPTVKFEGTISTAYNVIGNPVYGNRTFVLDSVTGLAVDNIGYLVDASLRPSDSAADLNSELVKIKAIDVGTKTITVYDMIRSNQNTGAVRFYKVTTVSNPQVRNLKIAVTNTNTQPGLWFYGCENSIAENIEVGNSTGHSVRHEYCYNFTADKIRIIKPYATGSGQGYGTTYWICRNGKISNVYGIGTRHLIDGDASFNISINKGVEEDGQSAVIMLSHNGYGGNISVEDIVATTDLYAVDWSNQGLTDEDLQLIRNITIKKIRHIIPTVKSDAFSVSVYIQGDFSNLFIDDVDTYYVDTSATPDGDSKIIRINGNQRGTCDIRNIKANECGILVYYLNRSALGSDDYNFVIRNLSSGEVYNAVSLSGFYSVNIDDISIASASNAILVLNNTATITPVKCSLGSNIYSDTASVFLIHSGLPAGGLKGKPPLNTDISGTALSVTNGSIVTELKILNSGGRLQLNAPSGSDATLDATTPFAAPLWIGQDLYIVVNGEGYTSTRGNVIIPSGSNTYADAGSPVTLTKGILYHLRSNPSLKWRLVNL